MFVYLYEYRVGDWVKKKSVPNHHLLIVEAGPDMCGHPSYQIFDTKVDRGHADFDCVLADELEANSELVLHADSPEHVRAILQRCQELCCRDYSILKRQDCESLQRYIHTGQEADRWSPQVVGAIVLTAVAVAVGVVVAKSKNN